MRNNVPADSVEAYFRRSIFISFLEHTIRALDDKFESHKDILSQFQSLLNLGLDENNEDISGIMKLAELMNLNTWVAW